MMLGYDRRKLGIAGGAEALGANPGMIGVDTVPAAEVGSGLLQSPQRPWGEGPQKNGKAPIDHREVRVALPHVVQQCRPLKERNGLMLETGHGREHIEAVALIIDGKLQEERRERAEESFRTLPLLRSDASGSMPPELSNPPHGGNHRR